MEFTPIAVFCFVTFTAAASVSAVATGYKFGDFVDYLRGKIRLWWPKS